MFGTLKGAFWDHSGRFLAGGRGGGGGGCTGKFSRLSGYYSHTCLVKPVVVIPVEVIAVAVMYGVDIGAADIAGAKYLTLLSS